MFLLSAFIKYDSVFSAQLWTAVINLVEVNNSSPHVVQSTVFPLLQKMVLSLWKMKSKKEKKTGYGSLALASNQYYFLSCPFPPPRISIKYETPSTCRLLTSRDRIFMFYFPNISLLSGSDGEERLPCLAFKKRPAVRFNEISTCVFTVCLSDLYKAFKSNMSCCSDPNFTPYILPTT